MQDKEIRLEMLGGLRVSVGGRRLHELKNSRTRAALFVYLAVEGEVSRDTVKAVFWPESDTTNARHALRQSLYKLRQILGEDWLDASGGVLRLGPRVTTDVREFEAAVLGGDHEVAARLYAGPFLHGLHLSDMQAWDGWVEARRLDLARAFRRSCRSWVDTHLASGDVVGALNAARAWIAPDPLDDEGQHRLLDLLVRAGDRTGAKRQYESYERLLTADGLTPLEETRALYESMLASVGPVAPVPPEATPPAVEPSSSQPQPDATLAADSAPPTLSASASSPSELANSPADRSAPAAEFAGSQSATITPGVRRPATKPVLLVVASAVLVAAGLTLGWNRLSNMRAEDNTPVASNKAWTIVADADGSAPEDIRNVARSLVAAAIDGSTILKTLPEGQIRRGLILAGRPDTTAWLEIQTARELAFRGSIRTVVAATIDQVGETFAVTVRVVDAESGEVIAVDQGSANGEDGLVAALDQVVDRIRQDLGERPQDIQATRRSRRVMTPSDDAYRRYLLGGNLASAGSYRGAIVVYREALGYDPDFAAAMWAMAIAYDRLGVSDSARMWVRLTAEHPERMTEVERMSVDVVLTGDPVALFRLDERLHRESNSNHNMYAYRLAQFGRYEEAVEIAQEGIALSVFGPGQTSLFNLAYWLLPLGRFDDARGYADRLEGALASSLKAQIANAEANWELADSLAVLSLQTPDERPNIARWAYEILASSRAARGRIHEATEILDHRAQLAGQQGADAFDNDFSRARLVLAMASNEELAVASDEESGTVAQPAPASSSSAGGQQMAALWAAWAGDTVPAATWLRSTDTGQEIPADGIDQAYRLLLQARVAAAAGRWAQVIQLLEPNAVTTVARTDPAISPSSRMATFNQLARWTLSEACEQNGDLERAAVWFSRIASYEGFADTEQVFRGLTHSFAHRRLALIYTRLEDIDRAKEHWQIFLDNFTDPDADVQWMADEARAELERFGRGPYAERDGSLLGGQRIRLAIG